LEGTTALAVFALGSLGSLATLESFAFGAGVEATTGAATAANYSPVFNAGFPMVILFAYESHGTANSGAATLQVDKLTRGQLQGDGSNMLVSGIDVTTTYKKPI
jgi:hypothetical protein